MNNDIYHVEVRGKIATVDEFWECDCNNNYVHLRGYEPQCPICGRYEDECPDARIETVLLAGYIPIAFDRREVLSLVD